MRYITLFLIFMATPALAAPRVATDIAPVHSLAAQVMAGVGEPDLLIRVGASPHGYSLRPSEAQALQDAEIVFWIGESLTPQLEGSIENLAADADVVELLGAGGSEVQPSRDTALFERHDDDHHDDHDDHKDDHADHDDEHADHKDDHAEDKHDDHADHAEHRDYNHSDHAEHKYDDHDAHGDDHHAHDHGDTDPHAWLDPTNAKAWLDVIAAKLRKADPANAATYDANAAAAKTRLTAVEAAVNASLASARGAKYIVFHDAYQYFEHHFEIPSAGAISIGDARKPSPARIAEIQAYAQENKITCVFSEPQFNSGIVDAIFGDTDVRTSVMDALGSDLTPGEAFYGYLLTNLGNAVASCLKG